MPPHKKVKLGDDLEPPPPNQLALVNARAKSATARSRARAVVRTKCRPRDPPTKNIKMLEELPMDVVYEIFSHLHPRDLLALARTSKGLRTVLLRHNCAFVWRVSRALVRLLDPVTSLDMSEPAFASTLFDNYCHGCGTISDDILWPVPVRYCDDCKEISFGESIDRVQAIASAANFEVDSLVLFTRTTRENVQLWHLPQLKKIEARLATLQRTNEKHRYVQAHVDYVAAWNKHVPALVNWLQDYDEKMRTEAEVLQGKHCVAAIGKLRETGWHNEIDMMTDDELYQLVALDRLTRYHMTDEGWGTFRPAVMDFLNRLHEAPTPGEGPLFQLRWRMRLIERALCQYRRSQGTKGAELEHASGLRFGDLVAMPAVRVLVEDQSPDLTRDAFLARLADMIPTLVVPWHEACKPFLVSLARADLTTAGVPLPEGPLTVDLAIMSFWCGTCPFGAVLRWPEVLGHACLRDVNQDEYPPPHHQVYETEAWRYLQELWWDQGKWDPTLCRGWRYIHCDTLSVAKTIRPALEVITACELDPQTATAKEMDENGARLVCRLCSEGASSKEVYDWKAAIHHDESVPWRDRRHSQDAHWIRLPVHQAASARALGLTVQNTKYICTWCYFSSAISDIRQHVQLHHEQENPRDGQDYYCQETMFPSVTMISEGLMQDLNAQKQVRAGRAFFARF